MKSVKSVNIGKKPNDKAAILDGTNALTLGEVKSKLLYRLRGLMRHQFGMALR